MTYKWILYRDGQKYDKTTLLVIHEMLKTFVELQYRIMCTSIFYK